MIEYDIHGLVRVTVDPRVGPAVIESIDFQIGAFRALAGSAEAGDGRSLRLKVGPYGGDGAHDDGDEGPLFVDPEARLAIRRTKCGLSALVHTGNFTINVLIQLLLAEQGASQVHAAGVVDGSGGATLLPGMGGVGKTALAGFLVKERGYRLLGDDLVIAKEDGVCLAVPRAFVLKKYHRKMFPEAFREAGPSAWWRWDFNLGGAIVANMPFKSVVRKALGRTGAYLAAAKALSVISSGGVVVPISRIFGAESLVGSGAVRRIVYLERSGGDFRVETARRDEICQRMFAVIHGEFRGSMGTLFDLGADGVVDLATYFACADRAIRRCVESAEVLRLRIPTKASAEELHAFYCRGVLRE